MRVPLAREGYPFIAGGLAAATLFAALAAIVGGTVLSVLAIISLLLALCMTGFFRDPARRGPRGPELVIAPADGKVVDVSRVSEPRYRKGESLRISIFLSLFDVHVNRYPVSGVIEHRSHDPGAFEPAWRESASHGNERAASGIDSGGHKVLVTQVAGLVARRIVTYGRPGDEVRQGDRMGLIRFGSRLDVYLPRDATPTVQIGQRARGGETLIARLAQSARETP